MRECEHSAACFQCAPHVCSSFSLSPSLSLCFSLWGSKCMLVGQLLHNRTLWVPSHVFCFSLGSAPSLSPCLQILLQERRCKGEEKGLEGEGLGSKPDSVRWRPMIPIIRLLDITIRSIVETHIETSREQTHVKRAGFAHHSQCFGKNRFSFFAHSVLTRLYRPMWLCEWQCAISLSFPLSLHWLQVKGTGQHFQWYSLSLLQRVRWEERQHSNLCMVPMKL